jgi:hypothetical protein
MVWALSCPMLGLLKNLGFVIARNPAGSGRRNNLDLRSPDAGAQIASSSLPLHTSTHSDFSQ